MAVAPYEILYIIDAALEESEIQRLADEMKSVIQNNGGQITRDANWGIRKLAYEIKKKTDGVYINLEFDAPETTPEEIIQFIHTHAGILRHLIIQIPKAKLIQEKIDAERKQKALDDAERERTEALAREAARASALDESAREEKSSTMAIDESDEDDDLDDIDVEDD
ncbi:MAG: 30S ribosomal protein S6 [Candidatus Omnitrophota bacterium]